MEGTLEGTQNKTNEIDIWQLKRRIWNFFMDEFHIDLAPIHFESNKDSDSVNLDIILMFPVGTKNLLKNFNYEKIKNFFVNELGMKMPYHYFLTDLKTKDNWAFLIEFYYDIRSYYVLIFISYLKNGENEFYLLNSIQIVKKEYKNKIELE